jgi:hypothetical protein
MKKLKEYNGYPNPAQFAARFLVMILPSLVIAIAIILLS